MASESTYGAIFDGTLPQEESYVKVELSIDNDVVYDGVYVCTEQGVALDFLEGEALSVPEPGKVKFVSNTDLVGAQIKLKVTPVTIVVTPEFVIALRVASTQI